MGLFKKRQQTTEELETMRTEMRSLREHLEKTDAMKDRLAQRVSHLDAENERLNRQVGSVEQRMGEVATQLASEPATPDASSSTSTDADADALAELHRQLEALTVALQSQQAQIADVALVATDAAERTAEADTRMLGFATPTPPSPVDRTPPPEDAEAKRQLGQLAEKVSAIDARVNQVSLELTNQLTELSSDLERAGEPTETTELIERITAQLHDVTGGQERLANEQARYAIQFRQDLAELADRLRKQR